MLGTTIEKSDCKAEQIIMRTFTYFTIKKLHTLLLVAGTSHILHRIKKMTAASLHLHPDVCFQ
jgi:hypothetical protein